MKVYELIELLKELDDPNKEIMIRDTAAGNRDIDYNIENCLNVYYTLHTLKKRGR